LSGGGQGVEHRQNIGKEWCLSLYSERKKGGRWVEKYVAIEQVREKWAKGQKAGDHPMVVQRGTELSLKYTCWGKKPHRFKGGKKCAR